MSDWHRIPEGFNADEAKAFEAGFRKGLEKKSEVEAEARRYERQAEKDQIMLEASNEVLRGLVKRAAELLKAMSPPQPARLMGGKWDEKVERWLKDVGVDNG